MNQKKEKSLNWRRINRAIIQHGRRQNIAEAKVWSVQRILPELIARCGYFSQSRVMVERIGIKLLQEQPVIIAPACPDYTHSQGKYTFRGVSGGISLLTSNHIAFLQSIHQLVPQAQVFILIADHEADDPLLCQANGVSREEFCQAIRQSISETANEIKKFGWQALAMTMIIPDLVAQETATGDEIKANPNLQRKISIDTRSRISLYQKIAEGQPLDNLWLRTLKTAAQYITVGRYAVGAKAIVCNHTTTNLNWYRSIGAAVLHNPVTVY